MPAIGDRRALQPAHLGVQARGIGDVADQPVEPGDVILDDRHQPLLLLGVHYARRGFDRTPERGQRVLDLVRHIGGEALDRIHAPPDRRRHGGQGHRQFADLVMALAEIRDIDLAAVAMADLVGGLGQAAHRPRDGAGQIERQGDRHRQHDQEQAQDIGANRVDLLLQAGAARLQHDRAQYLLVALDRHRDAQHQPALRIGTDLAGDVAFERLADLFIVGRGRVGVLDIERMMIVPAQQVRHAVDQTAQQAWPRLVERRQLLDLDHAAAALHGPAVGDHDAVGQEQAGANPGRFDQVAHQAQAQARHQHRLVAQILQRRTLAQGTGEDAALGRQRLQLRVDQACLIAVEIQHAAAQQRHGQYVDRQHAPAERELSESPRPAQQQPARPADRRLHAQPVGRLARSQSGLVRLPCIGNQRHTGSRYDRNRRRSP